MLDAGQIRARYTYPVKYVEEVLMLKVVVERGRIIYDMRKSQEW